MKQNRTLWAAILGCVVAAIILVLGTVWTGRSAEEDALNAVRSVSLLYLDELAGRREQVVVSNLQRNISDIDSAISLMTDEDLSDVEHLQAYQARMRKLYTIEKFAFVDTDGLIYTATGMLHNIDEYSFDYTTLSEPEISIFNLETLEKKVVIAVPVDIPFQDTRFKVCFMEIDMDEMLSGVSMNSSSADTTFCNIYTHDGYALTNMILGGLAPEDNLLGAMERASFDDGYTLERLKSDFEEGRRGVVSFDYDGIKETLSYVPVEGTDWLLTYLIRESVISEQISYITSGIIRRSVGLALLMAAVLIAMFGYIIAENRRHAREIIKREAEEAENRARHDELEQRLALQEKLVEEAQVRAAGRDDHCPGV